MRNVKLFSEMKKTERAGLRGIKQREFGFENVNLKVPNIYLGRDI